MIPLTVTAELMTPPICDRPLYFDAMLVAGIGAELGAAHPSGWEAEDVVLAVPLPLARVETSAGWWYAASHVVPFGGESPGHLNRVPLVEEAGRWTRQRSLNQAAGPDKRLRMPYYSRGRMLRLTWTCVGDREVVTRLLRSVPGVGKLTGHGHGWVTRWSVVEGGPPLEAYGRDLRLRHLPVDLGAPVPLGAAVMRRQIPLRPPYHRRREGVPCLQVQR